MHWAVAPSLLLPWLWLWLCLWPQTASPLLSSQREAMLRLPGLLNNPAQLRSWTENTDFCALLPSSLVSVRCDGEGRISSLSVVGDRFDAADPDVQWPDFSSDSLFSALSSFTGLKELHLSGLGLWGPLSKSVGRIAALERLNLTGNSFSSELPETIISLQRLQLVSLDHNQFSGFLSAVRWDYLHSLSMLTVSNNKLVGQLPSSVFSSPLLRSLILDDNLLEGPLPNALASAFRLENLSLSRNRFSGNIPDLRRLLQLQTINLQGNFFGPQFPLLGNNLVSISLSENTFAGRIPKSVSNLTLLQQLDLSSNSFSSAPPFTLFTMPSISRLNLARNRLSGGLPANLSLSSSLKLLDISFNLFTGSLPKSIEEAFVSTLNLSIRFERNCFTTSKMQQLQYEGSKCQAALAMAVAKPPQSTPSIALIAGVIGAAVGVAMFLLVAIALLLKKLNPNPSPSLSLSPNLNTKLEPKLSPNDNHSSVVSPEFLANARYISRAMKLGTLGLPQHRIFAIEELHEATKSFAPSLLLGEGQHGKVYQGQLCDGSAVAIRCLELESEANYQSLLLHLSLLAKYRCRHLVRLLGHCEETDNGTRRVFLVFDYMPNGTLQSRLAGKKDGVGVEEGLSWFQRLSILIGAAKGLHFLHTGFVPGSFCNGLKTTNILLDHNLEARLNCYRLPLSPSATADAKYVHYVQELESYAQSSSPFNRKQGSDKKDVFEFGLVLLETVLGRPPTIQVNEGGFKVKELEWVTEHGSSTDVLDPSIPAGSCVAESVATVMEISAKCLLEDAGSRPSMEDVLWNLQYALQVQNSSSSEYPEDIAEELLMPDSLEKKERSKRGRRNHLMGNIVQDEVSKVSSPHSDFFR